MPLRVQTHQFTIPCYLLHIEGADIVLGLDWLCTLGQVTANFATPSLSFTHNSLSVTLTGNPPNTVDQILYTHLHQIAHTHSIAHCLILSVDPINHDSHLDPTPNSSTVDFTHLPLEIQSILHLFPDLFLQPKGFPPPRPHDHHINLLPNTEPVNVKPYKYPHHQKDIVAQLIIEMLKDGIIKPRHSPFSSPVLPVKKKDRTWHFCVDYRALNAITVKDRFPIPTVDELLDELGKAKYFTKLDLRSGTTKSELYLPILTKQLSKHVKDTTNFWFYLLDSQISLYFSISYEQSS